MYLDLFLAVVRTNGIVECGLFVKNYTAVSNNVTCKTLLTLLLGRLSRLEKFLRNNPRAGFMIITEPGRLLCVLNCVHRFQVTAYF